MEDIRSKKLILVILDSVGVGALPDAKLYGDAGTNTISNIAQAVGGLRLPNLASLGLGNITDIAGVPPVQQASGCYGKMAEASKGKDSTIGHWEIAGIVTRKPFPVYPDGFPKHVLELFLRVSGCRGYLGNKAASGTEIIQQLGDEHIRTGYPIVYTSADSVFQIAAHEQVIPLEQLYEICRNTREHVMVDEHCVGRIIARPFVGTSGKYARTPNRRDFAIEPPEKMILDLLHENDIPTVGIGKIDDLFCGRGLKEKTHTKSNSDGLQKIIDKSTEMHSGCIMANLIDFDMLYGHRQDASGYAKALEEFDSRLPEIQDSLQDRDLLILTADHGNDPTDQSTDHTREYVPLVSYSPAGKKNVQLGVRDSFADVGKTIAGFFHIKEDASLAGKSFYSEIF